MSAREFIIELLYTMYKDKHFKNSKDLRNLFKDKYKLTYQECNEIILRIINYQVLKYGIQLYEYNQINIVR